VLAVQRAREAVMAIEAAVLPLIAKGSNVAACPHSPTRYSEVLCVAALAIAAW
jgi:hypothetical protein